MDIEQDDVAQENVLFSTCESRLQSLKKEYENFTYIISHDLAAPLRHIRQFNSLLLNSLENTLDERQQSFVTHINDSVERCQSMLDGMLSLSRIDTREQTFAETDINELIQRAVNLINEPTIEVQLVLKPVPHIFADRADLESALSNVIDNALSFQRTDVPLKIKISTQQEGDFIAVRIEDNGIGIDEKYSESIFDVFQTLDPVGTRAGIGVGLTLCRKIMSKHGGTITLEKVPEEQGSTFLLLLPITQ